MNRKVKSLISILLVAMMVFTFSSNVFAATTSSDEKEAFTPTKVTPSAPDKADTLKNTGNQIVGIIQVIGIILSVGIVMVIGIKYMMGSAQEKAEYKKVFVPYLIGAALLFGASVFAQAIYDIIPKAPVEDTKDALMRIMFLG